MIPRFLIQKKDEKPKSPEAVTYAPFVAATAALESRLRTTRRFSCGVVFVSLSIVALEEYRIGQMSDQLARSEFLVIPGAVDFMRVRPGVPPDEAVFSFADYALEQLGNFNYLNVEERHRRLAEFMTPECRERFFVELRSKIPRYREFSVTEIFKATPVKEYKLDRKDGKVSYTVTAVGEIDRYSGDQKIKGTQKEVVTLKFRTTPISKNKPWLFEIEEIERMSETEKERLDLAERNGVNKK